ncbi:MAG: alpha/beta hydrolase [Rhodobiaceae bacterium]|jgi:pimeloyl-ACP methyl ester carboxylesterase
MTAIPTPIFIPGLVCTADLFANQHAGLTHPVAPLVADTLGRNSLADMADAALDIVDGPLVPVGLSMGGYVALEMARQAPERIAGLVLLNTAYGSDGPAKRQQRLATIEMAKSDRFRGVTRHLMKSFLSPAAMADEALVARVIAMAEAVGRDNFVLQQQAILNRRDQSDTLRGLAVPALVLCGSLDTLTPPDISREMAALAPQAELVILDGVGHLSTMEAPERVTAHLNAFLASLDV